MNDEKEFRYYASPAGSKSPEPSSSTQSGQKYWSDGATAVLINAWRKKYLKRSCGILKYEDWQKVVEIVNRQGHGKTDSQCRNKIDKLKKKYKLEKARLDNEGGQSKWMFFDTLDLWLGSTGIPMRNRSRWDSDAAMSDDSDDSFLPALPSTKRLKKKKKKEESEGGGSNSKWRELSLAITRLGEAYEQMENAKALQVMEMERARMRFLKEMESKRMEFFKKTMLELSQLMQQRERRIENAVNEHRSTDATVNNNNNNDDDDEAAAAAVLLLLMM